MPQIGFGTYQISSSQTERCVAEAIKLGYRSIDTAQCYYNEAEVGAAIRKSGVPRQEIFVTTKVWTSGYKNTKKSIDESLKKMGLEYVDLLLIHEPSRDNLGTYKALEEAYAEKKARSIGLSNFYGENLNEILSNCHVMPVMDQIEMHVFRQQKEIRAQLAKYDIHVTAWSPLACGHNHIFQNKVLTEIAKTHSKSVAQVALRWLYEEGVVILPKSTHPARMSENMNILDFSLTPEEKKNIESLEIGTSQFGWW